jgi:hypothetical protein
MVSQEGFKSVSSPIAITHQTQSAPFGRPPGQFGYRHKQEYLEGELLMLSGGLYRVKAAEKMTCVLHMGMSGKLVTAGGTTALDIDLFPTTGGETDTGLDGFTVPAGTQVHIGAQGFNNSIQVVTTNEDRVVGRATATITFTGVPTNDQKITIISTDGTQKDYIKKASEDLTTDPCQFHGTDAESVAASLKNCIEDAEGGHNGKITVKHQPGTGVLRLTQATVGAAGETTITEDLANCTAVSFGGAAHSSGTAGRLTAITTDETALDGRWAVGDEVTVMFVPPSSTDGTDGDLLLAKRKFGFLESPDRRTIIYDLVWGISQHPKYIAANGDITNTGVGAFDANSIDSQAAMAAAGGSADLVDRGSGAHRIAADGSLVDATGDTYDNLTIGLSGHGGKGFGYGFGTAFNGMISPKIRVFQPRGVAKFTLDQVVGKDTATKAGWLTSENTSIQSPNPHYRIITGSSNNDSSIPEFQLLQDVDEAFRDPRIVISGYKYLLQEVNENEVREMIRRSGRFKYKIVADPNQSGSYSDGVTGPAAGWKEVVEANRGRKLSFEDYKNATQSVTTQTMNMLYGATPSENLSGTSDPRKKHRGI